MAAHPEPQRQERDRETPIAKRLPSVLFIVVSLVVATQVTHTWWIGIAMFLVTCAVCILLLHFAFGQPFSRLLSYGEPE